MNETPQNTLTSNSTVAPALPNLAQARKNFYDFLDERRPWAPCNNVYDMMEEIVDQAAVAFRSDHRPTKAEMRQSDDWLIRFTTPLVEHPDNYDGPCMCQECRDSA